jgi:formylglycine-generating enzyme required for sulfatase activity
VAVGLALLAVILLLANEARLGWAAVRMRRGMATAKDWVAVPTPGEGTFRMGCRSGERNCEAQRDALVPAPFSLMSHEVTVGEFQLVAKSTSQSLVVAPLLKVEVTMPGQPEESGSRHPVVSVDWFDAGKFCKFMGGRLPTSEEWEWAARHGQDVIYPWGNDGSKLKDYAVFGARLEPVKSRDASFGLYDLIGNAWEWTSSEDSQARVVRGGSWGGGTEYLRVSVRDLDSPSYRLDVVGFRCARDGSP